MDSQSRSRSRSPSNRREGKPRPPQNPPNTQLYVTFLPEDVEDAYVRSLFDEVAPVSKFILKKKPDGFTFAYVHFNSIEDSSSALSALNKRKIGDKSIRVQFARPRTQNNEDSRSRSRQDGKGRNYGGGGGGQSDARKRFGGGGGNRREEGPGGWNKDKDHGNRGGHGHGHGHGDRDRGDRDRNDRGDRDRNRSNSNFGGRGGVFEGHNRNQDGDRRPRGPPKCFKCNQQGHISKNCTGQSQMSTRSYQQPQGRGGFKNKRQSPSKMSEEQFCDY